jgi:splicing factor 3B subunit 4
MTHIDHRNQEATLFVGELDPKVSENLLWELFLQCGPIAKVFTPRDKLTREHMGYGFVEFVNIRDAEYAIQVMNMIKLYGKSIRVNKSTRDKVSLDVGANLFVGNLSHEIDEKQLFSLFSGFGVLVAAPKISRDPETGNPRGFAFINFDSFEAADAAIEALNGQYVGGRAISVTYALKKDSKTERHGSMAERILAANNPLSKRAGHSGTDYAAFGQSNMMAQMPPQMMGAP